MGVSRSPGRERRRSGSERSGRGSTSRGVKASFKTDSGSGNSATEEDCEELLSWREPEDDGDDRDDDGNGDGGGDGCDSEGGGGGGGDDARTRGLETSVETSVRGVSLSGSSGQDDCAFTHSVTPTSVPMHHQAQTTLSMGTELAAGGARATELATVPDSETYVVVSGEKEERKRGKTYTYRLDSTGREWLRVVGTEEGEEEQRPRSKSAIPQVDRLSPLSPPDAGGLRVPQILPSAKKSSCDQGEALHMNNADKVYTRVHVHVHTCMYNMYMYMYMYECIYVCMIHLQVYII